MHLRHLVRALSLAVLVILAGCVSQRVPAGSTAAPVGGPGAVAPAAAVERFLQLAQAKEYYQMGYLFGTAEGSVIGRDPDAQVERRMYGIGSVLRHDRYTLGGESPVPGSMGARVRVTAELHRGERSYAVPFVTVRGPSGRWFVEEVGLEAVTNPRR